MEKINDDLIKWILKYLTNSTTYHSNSSYFWKHVAERHLGRYVINDEFIITCQALGFKSKSIDGGVNFKFKFKPIDVKKFIQEEYYNQ